MKQKLYQTHLPQCQLLHAKRPNPPSQGDSSHQQEATPIQTEECAPSETLEHQLCEPLGSISEPDVSTSTPLAANKSFEQLLCNQIAPVLTSAPSSFVKKPVRRRIDPLAKVLTMEAFEKELEERERQLAKPKRKRQKTRAQTHPQELDDSTDVDMPSPIAASTSDEDEIFSNEESPAGITHLHFSKRNQGNLHRKIETEKFYLVGYGKNLGYIGKITEIGKTSLTMKFMKRLPEDRYDWPVKDSIDKVDLKQLVCGPIPMQGSLPFKIVGVPKALTDFYKYQKEEGI